MPAVPRRPTSRRWRPRRGAPLEHPAHRASGQVGPELDVAGQGEVGSSSMHQRNSSSSVSGALLDGGGDLEVVLGQRAGHGVDGDVGERRRGTSGSARPRSWRCSRRGGGGSRPCGRRSRGSRRRRSGRCRRCGTTSCGWPRPWPPAGPSSPRTSCGPAGADHDLAVGAGGTVVVVVEDAHVEVLVVDDPGGVRLVGSPAAATRPGTPRWCRRRR